MDLGPITSTAGSAGVSSASQALGVQDFLRVLATQLSWQDPLKPMDNQAFMAQMAQFTALEQSQTMNERMGRLLATQSALQSVALVGRQVDVSTSAGTVTGQVASLSLQGEQPVFSLSATDGRVLTDLALSQLLSVR